MIFHPNFPIKTGSGYFRAKYIMVGMQIVYDKSYTDVRVVRHEDNVNMHFYKVGGVPIFLKKNVTELLYNGKRYYKLGKMFAGMKVTKYVYVPLARTVFMIFNYNTIPFKNGVSLLDGRFARYTIGDNGG